MCSNPLVSIIIPVYNGANFLRKAIESALSQTYKNIEIIVVNDGSKDDGETERIALEYDERIRYYHKENGGVSTALNFGISKMKGDYFSWLSHDDEYTPQKIETQVDKLKYGADVIMCSSCQIDKDSKLLSKPIDYSDLESQGVCGWEDILSNILEKDSLYGCSLLIPKCVFDNVGLFNETLRYNQDYDMWLRICLGGFSWHFHNDIGVYARVHANQATQTQRDLFYNDSYKLGKELIPVLSNISTKENNYLFMYAKRCGKYNLQKNVVFCKQMMKEKNIYSFSQMVEIFLMCLYGKVRPMVRRCYYAVFKKVKTK